MEEYINKISQAFRSYLVTYFSNPQEIEVRGLLIEVIKFVKFFPNIDLKNIKLHELLSGDEISIDIQGTIQIVQRITGGSKNTFIEFWANNTTVRFDKNTADFELVNIPALLYIDFNN